MSRVDPATRASGTAASSRLAGTNGAGQGSRFGSSNAQAGARAILNRSTGTAAGTRLGNTANASRASSSVFTKYGQVFVHSANEDLELGFSFEVIRLSPGGHSAAPRQSHSFSSSGFGGGYRGGSFGGGFRWRRLPWRWGIRRRIRWRGPRRRRGPQEAGMIRV